MANFQKEIERGEQRKRPIALAVSFVLLFFCLMVVIIFATKNIGYQQQIQRETGEQIVKQFKELDRKLTYLQEQLAKLEIKSSDWDEAARLTSTNSLYLLEDVYNSLDTLLTLGIEIKPEEIEEQAEPKLIEWHTDQQELMQILSETEELTNSDYLQLKLLASQIEQMKEAVAGFNFKVEGNKSAMIRLSAGFDWMEQLHQLNEIVTKEQVQ